MTYYKQSRAITQRATELLHEVAREHRMRADLISGPQRWVDVVRARREFCRRGREQGFHYPLLAQLINRDRTTVVYHAAADYRERKNAREGR